MSRRSKACDISPKVRQEVADRDSPNGYIQCVVCESNQAIPNAHFIRRSKLGKGIPENIVSLCFKCHYAYDNYKSDYYKLAIMKYLRTQYPDWDEKDLYYKKGEL